jgi:hypothetical protein
MVRQGMEASRGNVRMLTLADVCRWSPGAVAAELIALSDSTLLPPICALITDHLGESLVRCEIRSLPVPCDRCWSIVHAASLKTASTRSAASIVRFASFASLEAAALTGSAGKIYQLTIDPPVSIEVGRSYVREYRAKQKQVVCCDNRETDSLTDGDLHSQVSLYTTWLTGRINDCLARTGPMDAHTSGRAIYAVHRTDVRVASRLFDDDKLVADWTLPGDPPPWTHWVDDSLLLPQGIHLLDGALHIDQFAWLPGRVQDPVAVPYISLCSCCDRTATHIWWRFGSQTNYTCQAHTRPRLTDTNGPRAIPSIS